MKIWTHMRKSRQTDIVEGFRLRKKLGQVNAGNITIGSFLFQISPVMEK